MTREKKVPNIKVKRFFKTQISRRCAWVTVVQTLDSVVDLDCSGGDEQ